MPVMGPYTWQYTWCQNCFWWIDVMKGTLGQQRNYFFTLSQGLGVSCLQFCKQPSSCILMLLCHLGWQKEVSPEGRGTPLLEETGFTLVQVPILSPGLNSLSVYAFHCWLLKWQESIEFPARTCAQHCARRGSHSVLPRHSCLCSMKTEKAMLILHTLHTGPSQQDFKDT